VGRAEARNTLEFVGIGRRWLVKGIMGEASTADILELAARVYEGLSPRDIDEIEEMAHHRAFFTDVEA
jgi:hypothetical protein